MNQCVTAHQARSAWGRFGLVVGLLVLNVSLGATSTFAAPLVPTGNVPLPTQGVYVFNGGKTAFDGTGWGGRNGFEGSCEGSIRQVLGLLGNNGEPLAVPAGQRITVGGSVVGFMNAAGDRRAFNMDVTKLSTAWGTFRKGDSLYVCSHGGFDDKGNKGGTIELDSGTRFNGFAFDGGPNSDRGTNARAALSAYPLLPNPSTEVKVNLHNCFSGRTPAPFATPQEFAVSTTLAAGRSNVVIVRSHQNEAKSSQALNVQPAPGQSLTNAQKTAATTAANTPTLTLTNFEQQYATGQSRVDTALGGPGRGVLLLGYGDTGEGGDPPDQNDSFGCDPGGPSACGIGCPPPPCDPTNPATCPPPSGATPELDSLLLMTAGGLGLLLYVGHGAFSRRRRSGPDPKTAGSQSQK